MKFESVRVDSYGVLRGVRSGKDPLPSIVVVLGPNESGKSTLFSFLTTILYGFRPATRKAHPYTPWDGGNPEGSASLRRDNGEVIEVRRRLLSTPRAELVRGEETVELRNHDLIDHVPLEIFLQVYALRLPDLGTLDAKSWETVQDQLIGTMGVTDLRPVGEVASDYETEASALWRPDRRGKPRARMLAAEKRQLEEEHRNALAADDELREKVAELARIRRKMAEIRKKQEEEEAERERLEHRLRHLRPVVRAKAKIARLRQRAGNEDDLAGLPRDPAGHLALVRRRCEEAEEQLAELEETARDVRAAQARAEDAQRRCAEHWPTVFSFPWKDWRADAEGVLLRELPTDQVARGVTAFQEREQQQRRSEEDLLAHKATASQKQKQAGPGKGRLAAGVPLIAGGAAVGILEFVPTPGWTPPWATFVEGGPVLGAAAVSAVVGLALVATWRNADRQAKRQREAVVRDIARREGQIKKLIGEVSAAREALAELVAGLPVRQDLLDSPEHGLADALGQASRLMGDAEARGQEAAHKAGRLASKRTEAVAKRDAAHSERRAFEKQLGALARGSAEHGATVAADRLEARRDADRLDRSLRRDYPNFEERDAEIARAEAEGERWDRLEEALDDSASRRQQLEAEARPLEARAGGFRAEIELREGETADVIESRITEIEEQIRAAKRRRDRAFLLGRLVKVADRRFRDENQPELLRRAGEHLRHLTGGRYDWLSSPDRKELRYRGPAQPKSRPVKGSLSQGTREQLYLALRLAIADHLDDGKETLPLFLDETLVNWDAARRDHAFELLERLSKRRQLFFFTCHPAMAAELEDRGGRIFSLAR